MNINEIVLKAIGYMKEGHDQERAIQESISALEVDVTEEQREKIREGLKNHFEAVEETEEEEANAEAETTATAEPTAEEVPEQDTDPAGE